eukprot:TRINITY_DN1470_c0_g1_i1.p2 TRINITY_DN1470_c0_g1~~TRINITY_DN1470_c0_g1_i1.p2  ORF type:complete len:125 (+),score=41.18 TRINITY_DN1470_c0_g1_i1:124-498(+)
MQVVSLGRLADGIFFSFFLLFIAGFGLFIMGELYKMWVVSEASKIGVVADVINKIVPFPKKKYEFNLSHVFLFALLIAMLSMLHHPAQDVIEQDAEKDNKKKEKRAKKDKEKKERDEKKAAKES